MKKQSGLTLVELIVTIFIASILLMALFMLSTYIVQLSASNKQRSEASQLAHNNMRIYANNKTASWLTCSEIKTAPGQQRIYTLSTAHSIPGTVVQTIEMTAPYGCDGPAQGFPARIVSRVTYNGGEVAYATFVRF